MSDAKVTDVQTEDMIFDVRLVPHSIRRGRVSEDAYEKHLAELPDEAEEAVEAEVLFTTPYANRLARESR